LRRIEAFCAAMSEGVLVFLGALGALASPFFGAFEVLVVGIGTLSFEVGADEISANVARELC
jgi:hypothetical protein